LRDGTTKHLFKKAMRGIVPDAIIDRPKHGFAVPLAQWFRGDLAEFTRDVLLSGTCRQRGLFDAGYVERLLRMNDRGRDSICAQMLSFEMRCQRLDAVPRHSREPKPTG
jgi:asparagine synthase (glutamine-hydrolysing)